MNGLAISKALALAIGWKESQMIPSNATQRMYIFETEETTVSQSKIFDYRDWNVIGPIAERYDLFPRASGVGWYIPQSFTADYADTSQKAIALAVINGSKK